LQKERDDIDKNVSSFQLFSFIVVLTICFPWQVNNFLLTEREVCTEKYRTEVFFVQTEPLGRGLYKKTEVRYFSVHTEQARLIKSLLYGIYRHLYSKQTRNAWFEMHISSVVHIWLKKTKEYQCIPSFPLRKTFADILLIAN
jgi:hypothetical protein